VEKVEERMVLQEASRRRFYRKELITVKDLDFTMVVLVQGTKSSCLSQDQSGRRDVAEKSDPTESQRYLRANHSWALKKEKDFVFYASRY